MNKFVGYRCSLCGTQYSPTEITYTCPKDGGNLDVLLDYEALKSKYKQEDILSRNVPSLWRYLPLLPVREPEGSATPLHAAGAGGGAARCAARVAGASPRPHEGARTDRQGRQERATASTPGAGGAPGRRNAAAAAGYDCAFATELEVHRTIQ